MEQTLTLNDQLVELGNLAGNESTAVQRVGARLVDEFFQSEPSKQSMETIANVLYYLTDIQVRDYALGLLGKYDAKQTELALCHLVNKAPEDTIYINAPASILAQWYYEQNNTADAFLMLSIAQENYSLALLLARVFKANAPKEMFAKMRAELHPQVVKGIFGEDN